MELLSEQERRLIMAIQDGLPLVSHPYQEIGRLIGIGEDEVIALIRSLLERRIFKRIGVIVRHHELGYLANGMVVWDIPDDRVAEMGHRFSTFDFVTLCYRRPRRLPDWPYNLFCMVHGKERSTVLAQVEEIARACDIIHVRREVLFSGRRFRQRGAHYELKPGASEDGS